MKHNKIIAGLAIAGSLLAVSGAANAIAPAAALGLAAIGGAAVGSAAANANDPPAVAVVPAAPSTVVMGAPAAPAGGHYEVINGVYTWVPGASSVTTITTTGTVNYDHDADGVLNHVDRYPNDPSRS